MRVSIDDALESAGVKQQEDDELPDKETLVAIHKGLHSGAASIHVNGQRLFVDDVDRPGKDFRRARLRDVQVITQNLRKESRNTIKVKMRRANGKTYDLSWVIHDDRGYVAKVETTDEGTTLEWL